MRTYVPLSSKHLVNYYMFRGIKKAIRHPKTILRPAAKAVVKAVVQSAVQSAVGALGK